MNLTEKQQEQLQNATTKEERIEILKDAGIELTDEEMESISGGTMTPEEQRYYLESIQRLKEKAKTVRQARVAVQEDGTSGNIP